MAHRVCPPFLGYLLACPLRRLLHNPGRILSPFVSAGMTVLDVGPAMGFFTLPVAKMVGPSGKVVCVDVQEQMLQALGKRAKAAGVADRLVLRACGSESLGLDDFAGQIDFALAFAVVHEVPNAAALFADVAKVLRPGGRLLVAEPSGHVPITDFEEMVSVAKEHGLEATEGDAIPWCHVTVLCKR